MPPSSQPFPHTLIRASAGAGKTFQLSNRYLGLAAADVAPDEILATTFTRKAAGEILERVLTRLAEAADNSAKAGELAGHLHLADFTTAKAQQTLQTLVHQLHRLHISTLDAFFAQLARSFDLELGLAPGWRIIDEAVDARLRDAAVQAVLAAGETNDTLKLLHLLAKGEITRSVTQQLQDVVSDLYALYQQTTEDAWKGIERPPRLSEEQLAAAIEELSRCLLPNHKSIAAAREKDLAAARAKDWESFIDGGVAKCLLCGQTEYYKKPITEEMERVYGDLVRHATGVLVGHLVDRNKAARKFLDKFHDEYSRLKLARRALRFDDITLALGKSSLLDGVRRLAFRLDARLDHVLFDEFQDTSLEQWKVLRPLVAAAMGERKLDGHEQDHAPSPQPSPGGRGSCGSFFCVGDPKQAIYGWRGGVPELFDSLSRDWPGLDEQVLPQSRRSSPPIIYTVNRVFDHIEQNAALAKHQPAALQWRRNYQEHSTAKGELPGHARMIAAPAGDSTDEQKAKTLTFAAREVARLVQAAPGKSVGVLVRSNDAIATLIQALASEGISASEEGGNPLTDSPAVLIVLSLLTLADHPGDTVARYHVAQSPLGPAVGLDDINDRRQAERVSLAVRRRLLGRGYGHTIYGWARRLTRECGPRDASRLFQLVELAYRYEPEAGLRTRDFIERVRSEHIEAPTPADVRVMTIHKSKGLEFDIVVLPQLDVNLIGQTPPVLVGRPDAVAPIDFICRYPNESLRRLLPQKALDAYERYGKQVLRESLCVLYVALTRAIHALHVIVAPAKKNEKSLPATFAGLLRAALAGGVPADAETVLYEHGNPLWHEKLADSSKPRASSVETPRPAALKVAWAPTPKLRRRGLDRESPSARAHSAKVELATLMALDDGRAASRGSVFHAWFEQIEWLESSEPDGADVDEAAMRRIGARVGASPEDLAEWLAQFRAKLQNPVLRSVLSRGTYLTPRTAPWAGRAKIAGELAGGPPVLEVFRERPFAVRLRDTLLNGTFDRLVLARAQPAAAGKDGHQQRVGKLVAAEVLDFKTDALAPDDPKAIDKIVDRYRPQLSAYREAVCGMFALPADRVMTRLVLLEADAVREVVDSHE